MQPQAELWESLLHQSTATANTLDEPAEGGCEKLTAFRSPSPSLSPPPFLPICVSRSDLPHLITTLTQPRLFRFTPAFPTLPAAVYTEEFATEVKDWALVVCMQPK